MMMSNACAAAIANMIFLINIWNLRIALNNETYLSSLFYIRITLDGLIPSTEYGTRLCLEVLFIFLRSSSCNLYVAWLHCSCIIAYLPVEFPKKLLMKPWKQPSATLWPKKLRSHLLNAVVLRAGVEVSLDGLIAVLRVVHPHARRDPLHVLQAPLSSSVLSSFDGSFENWSTKNCS